MFAIAAAALAGGATYAYFSAQGSVENNQVSTGTLKLDVNEGEGKPITVSDIAPGYADNEYRWFDAFNKGTSPAEFFMAFTMDSGDQALYDALRIELRDGGYTGECDGPAIYDGLLKDFVENSKISAFNVHAATSGIDATADNIPAGYTMRVCQKIALPETGLDQNALQDTSVTFTETVNSRQDSDPDKLP